MRWLHLPLTRDVDVTWARSQLQDWLLALDVGAEAAGRIEQWLNSTAQPGPEAAVEFGWDPLRARPYGLFTTASSERQAAGSSGGAAALDRRLRGDGFDFSRHGLDVHVADDQGTVRLLLHGHHPCTGEARQALHRRVVQQTASSTEPTSDPQADTAALRQATAKAVELARAMKAKDEFLAVAYHDLRSPLSTAKGALEIIESTLQQANDDQKHLFLIARKAFDTLVQLVSNLMSTQLLELYEDGLPRSDVDLGATTREVVEALSIQARLKGIQISCEWPTSEVIVPGDPEWLRQIAASVIHNAVKFTEKNGHVSVRVGAEPGQALLVVEDDGVGIPQDQTERVFERLTRLRPRGTAGERGTGIGLYVCKRWVDRLGGTIRVIGRSPVGTRFEIRLPTS